MMDPHNSESFAPVILGLSILVVTPALAQLVPPELVATLTATPLRRTVSAVLLAILVAGWAFWTTPGVSLRSVIAGDGGDG